MPFPITCAACQKTFSISDDVFERKVKGRVVTIKCKQCQAGIRVDGTKDTPVFSMAGDSVRPPPAAPASAAPAPAVAAPVAAAAVEPALVAAAAPKEQPKAPLAAPAPKAAPAAVALAPKAASPAAAAKAPPPAAPTAASKAITVGATPRAAAAPAAKAQPIATTAKAPALAAKAQPAVTPKAPAVEAAPKAPAASPLAARAASAAAATPPAPAATAAAPGENLWAVDYPDGEDRELTLLEIEKELARGVINPTTLVWREGMDEWLELGQVPELQTLTAPPKAPPAPLPPQRPKAASAPGFPEFAAPRAKAASAPALPELSATLPQPTLPQAPAPRPPAPSSPAIDFALRDALKTPAPAPLPKSPPTFAQPIAALTPQPFPAASQPLTAASFQTAPTAAAPFGRPSPTPFGAVAPIADIPEWPKKSRLPLIIGGIAVVAVGALIFVLTRSSGDALPPATPISALPATAPTTASAPRAAEPAPADTGAPSEPKTASGDAMQPPGSAPMATPNAGFAELFASGARGADEKHGVTGPTQRFDAKAAKAALASAASQTPQCREKGGPAGKATVVVTFEASGKVSSATVSDPPFAGTSSGACIAAALKRATVPAFSGLPGTVTKIISIQ